MGGEGRKVTIPAIGQFPPLNLAQLIGEFWVVLPIGLEQGRPLRRELSTPFAYSFLEMLPHPVRHEEFRVLRPPVGMLGETNLLLSKWLPVGFLGILLMWGSIADMTIHNDQGGAILCGLKGPKCTLEHLQVIDIAHPRYIPPISDEACGDILTKG